MSNNPPDTIVAQHEDVKKISSEANKGVWSRFGKVKPVFFQHLAENFSEELKAAGMSPSQIAQMAAGKSPNQGNESDPWMVHHTTPRTVSGNLKNPNDFSNLVLIRKSSEQVLHHFIDPQYASLKPGESTNILMVRPSNEFCGLTEKQTDALVKQAILNPQPNNSHAPENQGGGRHTHGRRPGREEEAPQESHSVEVSVGGESDGESEAPKPSQPRARHDKKNRKNKKRKNRHSESEHEYNSYKGGKHFSMDDEHAQDRHQGHGMR